MKMKNVNFIQLHVEKLILGGAALVALLLLLIYVVRSHTATIGGKELGPSETEQTLLEQARELGRRLDAPDSPLPEIAVAPYTQEFRERVGMAPAGLATLPVPMNQPGLDKGDVGDQGPIAPWAVPTPPLAANVKARASYGVLGQIDNPQEREAIVQMVGNNQPADFRYVSVAADFPMDEWQKRLAEAPGLPSQFYRGIINLAGVYLQREELDPETGEWINSTIVEPLPTQAGFTDGYAFEFTKEQADGALTFIKANQERIARPEFLPLAAGPAWLPPDADFGNITREEHKELSKLRADIKRLEDQIRRSQERQKALQNRPVPGNRPGPGPGGPPRGRRGGMDEFGDPGAFEAPPPMPNAADEEGQRLQRAMDELARARARYTEIVGVPPTSTTGVNPGEFGGYDPNAYMGGPGAFGPGMSPEMMEMPYGGPGMPGMPPNFGPQPAAQPGQEDQAQGNIKVWAHDLTIEPGKTYRYRILVSVINPLFRRSNAPEEQKKTNFNKIALGPDLDGEVAKAPWSEPVRVDPEFYFFVLQAAAQSQQATVEVWRVYNGQWQYEKFPAQPGDVIGGLAKVKIADGRDEQIDMNVGAMVVDVAALGQGGVSGGQTRLLFLEPGSQAIAARNPDEDRENPDRIRLQNERALQEAMQPVAAAH